MPRTIAETAITSTYWRSTTSISKADYVTIEGEVQTAALTASTTENDRGTNTRVFYLPRSGLSVTNPSTVPSSAKISNENAVYNHKGNLSLIITIGIEYLISVYVQSFQGEIFP